MAIVFDPELYRATEKHFAHHPLPGYESGWETWHADACYDNGYFSTVMLAVNGPIFMVDLRIVNAAGEPVVESMQFFPSEEFVASTDTFDIRMGHNYLRGEFPRFEIHVRDGDHGVDLTYEPLVQPTISELPDGVGIGRVAVPDTPVFVGWFFQPKSRITGKLTIGGQEIPVTGQGFSDHQFGSADFFEDAVQFFIWGCLPLGEHTVNFFDAQTTRTGGYRPFKWLWDWKGEKLVEYCRDADFYIRASNIAEGDTVPRTLVVVFEHARIRGTVTCEFTALIQKQPLELKDRTVVLNRSAYDCHAQLEIDNDIVDTRFTRIVEVAYPVRAMSDPS